MSRPKPETPSSSPRPPESYGLGLGLSIFLSLWVTGFSLKAIFDTDLTGQEWLSLVLVGFSGAGALALALLITLLVYFALQRRDAPRRVLLPMVAPPLLAAVMIPLYLSWPHARAHELPGTHPGVSETHVNLSGQPLCLSSGVDGLDVTGAPPRMPMAPTQIVSFSRYSGEDPKAAAKFPYDAAHLRSSIRTYSYGCGDEHAQGAAQLRTLPLVRRPYPDLHQLTPYEREGALLLHQYFHYRDHVEMVPSLQAPSESFEHELQDKVSHLVKFYLSNRVGPAIARLEVNGQTLVLAQESKIATSDCSHGSTPIGYALVDLDTPLLLRWQTLNDPARWHEASVSVPAWRHALPGTPASLPSVTLYFTRESHVTAERFQLLSSTPPYKDGLIATGMPAGVVEEEVCGSAADYYPDYFKRFQ